MMDQGSSSSSYVRATGKKHLMSGFSSSHRMNSVGSMSDDGDIKSFHSHDSGTLIKRVN